MPPIALPEIGRIPALEESEALAVPGVYRVARGVQGAGGDWGWLQVRFLVPWRDDLGNVRELPHLILSIRMSLLKRLRLENLSPEDFYAKCVEERPAHKGWVYWPRGR